MLVAQTVSVVFAMRLSRTLVVEGNAFAMWGPVFEGDLWIDTD